MTMTGVRPLLAAVLSCATMVPAYGATLTLKEGRFYGPGNKGSQAIVPAGVRGIVLTGPLSGEIPFFNNGPELPNVIAEVLQGGVVDGYTSNGVAINENIDTGLFLVFSDPETGESARMMVVGVAPEQMVPDAKGNLTFNPSVIGDPGTPELAVPFSVMFTTGAAQVPLSLKTQQGLPGGHDQAGPFPSGRILIGRIGDFDQDGFLDGELVLAANPPLELIVARGDPIAQRRPWTLDVPVPPVLAAVVTLNGLVQNFPDAIGYVFTTRDYPTLGGYVVDMLERVQAARLNLARAGAPMVMAASDRRSDASDTRHPNPIVQAARLLAQADQRLQSAAHELGRPRWHHRTGQILRDITAGLELSGQALQILASLPPPA